MLTVIPISLETIHQPGLLAPTTARPHFERVTPDKTLVNGLVASVPRDPRERGCRGCASPFVGSGSRGPPPSPDKVRIFPPFPGPPSS